MAMEQSHSPRPRLMFPWSVLMLGYSSGLQLRDCAYLGSVLEPFNFARPQWGDI